MLARPTRTGADAPRPGAGPAGKAGGRDGGRGEDQPRLRRKTPCPKTRRHAASPRRSVPGTHQRAGRVPHGPAPGRRLRGPAAQRLRRYADRGPQALSPARLVPAARSHATAGIGAGRGNPRGTVRYRGGPIHRPRRKARPAVRLGPDGGSRRQALLDGRTATRQRSRPAASTQGPGEGGSPNAVGREHRLSLPDVQEGSAQQPNSRGTGNVDRRCTGHYHRLLSGARPAGQGIDRRRRADPGFQAPGGLPAGQGPF